MLEALQAGPDGLTLAQLSAAMSLHPNTIRDHLDSLVSSGLVTRSTASPEGRGRPAWVYAAASRPVDPQAREYAGLASTLASALRRHSPHPAEDARAAGREWGAHLAGSPSPAGTEATPPHRAALELLERLQFAPVPDAAEASVRLTRCPLLEAAELYPDVVCSVHTGLVEGALARWGDTSTTVQLLPFAESGACLLHMTPVRGGAAPTS